VVKEFPEKLRRRAGVRRGSGYEKSYCNYSEP
jgi:hypothetical protein